MGPGGGASDRKGDTASTRNDLPPLSEVALGSTKSLATNRLTKPNSLRKAVADAVSGRAGRAVAAADWTGAPCEVGRKFVLLHLILHFP
jgi:hypothetical protein